jgi:hypothetical protein
MDATISEPFVLSSYSLSQRLPKSTAEAQTPSNVYATYDNGSGSSDGYVTVTAQGDGVHVLDVGIRLECCSLHPNLMGLVSSYPLSTV